MSQDANTKGGQRTVYAPESMLRGSSPVISLRLEEDEEVQWQWTHYSSGQSVVTGYEIVKKKEIEEPFDIKRALSAWLWGRNEDKKLGSSASV